MQEPGRAGPHLLRFRTESSRTSARSSIVVWHCYVVDPSPKLDAGCLQAAYNGLGNLAEIDRLAPTDASSRALGVRLSPCDKYLVFSLHAKPYQRFYFAKGHITAVQLSAQPGLSLPAAEIRVYLPGS